MKKIRIYYKFYEIDEIQGEAGFYSKLKPINFEGSIDDYKSGQYDSFHITNRFSTREEAYEKLNEFVSINEKDGYKTWIYTLVLLEHYEEI